MAQSSDAVGDAGSRSGSFDSAHAAIGFWYPKWAWLEPMRHAHGDAVSSAPPHA